MIKYILAFFILEYSFLASAQNLVYNYSFEEYDSLPIVDGEGFQARYWYSASSTPDCIVFPDSITDQRPKSGNVCMGMFVYNRFNIQAGEPTSLREYIGSSLKYSLKPNRDYYIEINILLPNFVSSAISTFGVYFSESKITTNSGFLNLIPQVENPLSSLLDSKNNWQKVVGYYKASGGESYVTLGNYREDLLCGFSILNQNELEDIVYYYIDDVLVVDVDSLEFLTSDINAPKEEGAFTSRVKVFPNPTSAELYIYCQLQPNEELSVGIYDLQGRLVAEKVGSDSYVLFDLSAIASGVYVCKTSTSLGFNETERIVINK